MYTCLYLFLVNIIVCKVKQHFVICISSMWLICHIWSSKELCNIMYHNASNSVLLNINISVFLFFFLTFGQDKKGSGDVDFITSCTSAVSRIYYSIKWKFRQNVEEDMLWRHRYTLTMWIPPPPPTFLFQCPPETVRPRIVTPVSLMGSGFGLPRPTLPNQRARRRGGGGEGAVRPVKTPLRQVMDELGRTPDTSDISRPRNKVLLLHNHRVVVWRSRTARA